MLREIWIEDLPVIDMKKVACVSPSCAGRRVHFEQPDVARGEQTFWVPATHPGPFFCSIECAIYWKSEMKKEITSGSQEG